MSDFSDALQARLSNNEELAAQRQQAEAEMERLRQEAEQAERDQDEARNARHAELAAHLNDAFGTDLTYTPMSVEEYRADRIAELGEFMGTIIAGIYQGIREGAADRPSHYLTATGRNHLGWDEYFSGLAAQR